MVKAKEVLVVEDDIDIRESMTEFLLDAGFSPRAAENGQRAIELLQTGYRPDVILLDLMMPVMDGFAFREEQMKNDAWAKIPVVVMSADGNITQKQARIGAASYLKKPIDIELLVKTLEEA